MENDNQKINESKLLLDDNTLKNLNFYMPKEKSLRELADFFSMFSDPTRLKIISALSMSEMCVSDIANVLKLNQTTVSHQLKTLKSLGMVKYRRDGKIIYYSLIDKLINDCLLVNYTQITWYYDHNRMPNLEILRHMNDSSKELGSQNTPP